MPRERFFLRESKKTLLGYEIVVNIIQKFNSYWGEIKTCTQNDI